MNPHNVYIRNIRQANEDDRLAVFIGAGVSKSSDTEYIKLPLWSDLIEELKSDLAISQELDYLKLAQLYYLEFGEQTYNHTLKKYFPEDVAPSILHRTILKLNPRVIITTNWDSIIENAIEQEGYLYDTICTDKDLVGSTSPNKFIKIHGDFKSHNIVFKEDDYLNYSINFPLIENYIKSIFSTHTVLFLGYSYNDINLKHIMKWIQSHSSSAPPMYLVTFNEAKPQSSYLRNHGITTLVLDANNYPTVDIELFDKRSALTQSFITSIIQDDAVVDPNNEQEVIGFIYEQVKHLKQQSSVTHDQVRRAITNCRFYYDADGLSLLELSMPHGVSSQTSGNITRSIHTKLLDILARLDLLGKDEKEGFYRSNSKFSDILSILALARVKGIVLPNEDDSGQIKYFVNEQIASTEDLEQDDREHMSLSNYDYNSNDTLKLLSSDSYNSYKHGNYELAFKNNSELIIACKKHKIFSILLIALFNKNVILSRMKYSLSTEIRPIYNKEMDIDLQHEFFKFPRSEIKKNQVLYDFLAFHSVHQEASECTRKILKLKKSIDTIKAGGWVFNRDADEPTCTHINLLMFALKNHIMIDHYSPYKAVMRDFVKISILRQSVKTNVTFNQYEFYSAIQFYSSKELRSELIVFSRKDDSSQLQLNTSCECTNWVVFTVLPSLITRFMESHDILDGHEIKFENCVRLLAFLDLSEAHISKIMSEFSRLITSSSATIGSYEAINEFLAYQYSIFQKKIETDVLVNILNNLIDKLISRNAHGWDRHAILNGTIDNLYGYIGVAEGEYADENRVRRLVSELEASKPEDQRAFSRSLLYSIFNISNGNVKSIIGNFIKGVISKFESLNDDDWEFELWSVAVGFKDFELGIIERLDTYLEHICNQNMFSSRLFTLNDLILYLIEEKGVEALKPLETKLGDLINRHKDLSGSSCI